MKQTQPARPFEADYPPLMLCQVAALRAYAASHGDRWKDDLRHDWMDNGTDPALRRLRRTHGSRWRASFNLQH